MLASTPSEMSEAHKPYSGNISISTHAVSSLSSSSQFKRNTLRTPSSKHHTSSSFSITSHINGSTVPLLGNFQPNQVIKKKSRATADRPVVKLSVHILQTYKQINERYYREKKERDEKRAAEKAKQKQLAREKKKEEIVDYVCKANQLLNGRYNVIEEVGKGSFGRVVKAHDTLEDRDVAVKLIKAHPVFLKQAQIEIKILEALGQGDIDKWNVVRMYDTFMHEGHQCIVFEYLSDNLYQLLKSRYANGMSVSLISNFAKQLLNTLGYLSRTHRQCGNGQARIIHCDLKPENILLRFPGRSPIKVIDFGSSCFSDETIHTYIQSRFYRAPEVLLGLPYTNVVDMWSLGCVLAELHIGRPLFAAQNETDLLVRLYETIGTIPQHLISATHYKKRGKWFVYNAEQDLWVLKPVLAAKIRPNRSLLQLLGLDRALSKLSPEYQRLYMRFHSLLEGMLQYSPTTRIRPAAASSHLFFRPNDREIAVQTDQKDDSDVREDREHASPQAEHESNGLDEQTQHGESMLSKNTRVAKPSTQMSVSP